MGLSMKKILDKFSDCNKFCLTGPIKKNKFTITEEEYDEITKNMNNAEKRKVLAQFKEIERYNITEPEFEKIINNLKNETRKNLKCLYESNKDKLKKYSDFDSLYNEIEKECYEFNNKENREYYINKHYDDKEIEWLKQMGYTDEEIEKQKSEFFQYSFIADKVGKTTKYGIEYHDLFYQFYAEISNNIDREQTKTEYCTINGKNPVEQVPVELRDHLLYYEASFHNEVTMSGGLLINYYFKINEETKKYLLKFQNDFYLDGLELEDLALYKDEELNFYSCTHEGFNSLEFNYQNMTKEEIIDFVNDEITDEDNTTIINAIIKVIELINMDENIIFTFKEIGIEDKHMMYRICYICNLMGLSLTSKKIPKDELIKRRENSNDDIRELPALYNCTPDDIIGKEIIF